MRYEGSLYRPPSEAYSLIVQATIGCTHNKCTFCSMYKDKKFRIRNTDEIIEDFKIAREKYKYVKRIFIADGDALAIKTKELVKIFSFVKEFFPECERVGIYGSPRAILSKTNEELDKLKSLGLGIIYLGVESGSDKILKDIKKGVTREEMVRAGKMVVKSGIELSITLISGIGGQKDSYEHAVESAKIINEINPNYVGLLTLLVEENTPLYEDVKNGQFTLLTPKEVLLETKKMVENITVENCIFRSNHASNYVALKGTLPKDKDIILSQIEEGLKIANLDEKDLFRRL
ncbi:Radical SAM superfamily protein [Tissierella praeacuta DSM 18095]|uniref:Radical SAM superfamily protein n=1 Tax=Tissierella praeacuta DSM 18095 TaxID=1123404 RepID=A0A1M4XWX0_9FIRM|nr:radical SAM protein [Tissierella praeacuta]SHE97959.1 Radical SAM superfamily protein [Tissierella praeacuta DSM 18095]SUP03447.1 coproporphyrinogen III oxidase [Tissierella praeacuta]